ncbi:MAG: hypothetical protein C4537_07875 [Acholeplasma sp.]|jgi:hypothetical protein|nr:MAG: hypothetical protein C4537_07875 [Acholeplasma sp.]
MNLKYNSMANIILAIFVINLSMLLLIGVSIGYMIETERTNEGILGICFGIIFAITFDVLFFLIRKHLFSKVLLVDGTIKITYFRRTLKQIEISSINFMFIETNTIYLFTDIPQNIDIKTIQHLQQSPNTIMFRIDIKKIGYFLSQMELNEMYCSKKIYTNYESEIEKYISLIKLP